MTVSPGRRPAGRIVPAPVIALFQMAATFPVGAAEVVDVPAGPAESHWLLLVTAGLLVGAIAIIAVSRYRALADLGRRMAAEQIRQTRLNAALAALSGCNQALMRTADEPRLLAEVCRVVGECLSIRAVSVTLDGTATPAATWPAGGDTADSVAVCLPLMAEGRRLGVLILENAGAQSFSDEEGGLLERLADDIAFGILALRHRDDRRRAAQALRDSEERFRSLVDNMTDFVWEVDAAGRYTYASARVQDILGYAPKDILGKTPFDLMPPDEAARLENEVQDIMDLRLPIHQLENVNVTRNGRMVVMETSGMPMVDADGVLLGYRGVDRDITERKRAEAELRWEADVRGVFAELGRLLMAPISIEQVSRTVVDRGCRLIGAQRGCACYREPTSGRMICTTPSGHEEGLCTSISEGRSVMVNSMPDGLCSGGMQDGLPVRRLLSVPVTIDGASAGRLTFADADRPFESRDMEVAERLAVIYGLALRRAWDERALVESRTKLETVTAAAQDGIVMLDDRGRVDFWNNAAARIFGRSESEMVGHPLDEMLTGPGTTDLLRIGGDDASRTLEVEGIRKDGSRVPIEITVVAARLGDRWTAVATVKDLTERKEAERLRLEMEKQLFQAQKMDALGTLAGGIAHNFNNMLMPVMVLTELTLNELPADSPGRKRLEAVLQASRHARDLIQRILTFGRQDVPSMELLSFRDMVIEGLELLRSALPRSIDIREQLDDLPGLVMADRGQLLTVLMNLGSNAADAMEGSTGVLEVSLVAEMQEDGLPDHLLPPGAYARLSVHDSGHGMDEETLRRVFEPFFTTKGVGRGTGLGLATAQAIVAAHGGGIRVRSAPGQGTTFDIYLPLAAAMAEAV